MSWFEGGKAPNLLPASSSSRTRPVYAYPIVARYTGSGSIDDAANFKPFTPPAKAERYDWLGAKK
jgi:feruloyl esterase